MTPEQINRIIAEKVMGWVGEHKGETRLGFDPYHNISHAMMALEKFKCWYLKKVTSPSNTYYSCDIFTTEDKGYSSGYADTPSSAISRALVEAVKEG